MPFISHDTRRAASRLVAQALAATLGGAGLAHAGPTLDAVRARGEVRCGVEVAPGFAAIDGEGRARGFDVDLCRAVAAATLRAPEAIRISWASTARRLESLAQREIDIALGAASWTLSREVEMPVAFVAVVLHDQQGFIVWADSGIGDVAGLAGRRICAQTGTTALNRLRDGGEASLGQALIVETRSREERLRAFLQRQCDAVTGNRADLTAALSEFRVAAGQLRLLPGGIGREATGPAVRADDADWRMIVRWTVAALIAAEHHGVTRRDALEGRSNAAGEIHTLLGLDPERAGPGGLDAQWARRVIATVGNYRELYERHLGAESPLKLPRGPNLPWSRGGLLYAPSFR